MLCVVTYLPDASVGLAPVFSHPVGEAGHRPPRFGVEAVSAPGEKPGGVEHPPVRVELMLAGGAVAHSDRRAVGVAGPAVDCVLGSRVLAMQREQWGQA